MVKAMRKYILSLAVTFLFLFTIAVASSVSIRQAPETGSMSQQEGGSADEWNTSYLPIMSIDTGGERVFKEMPIWCDFQVYRPDNGLGLPEGSPVFSSLGTIKYRGNSSYSGFDKRSYRIKFYRDEHTSRNYGLFGMGADSEWVLNGPFLDRSLLRNRLMFRLSGELLPWSPETRYFELYVNGDYRGVYLAIEPITAGPSRIGLAWFSLSSGATPYIIGRDRVGTEENEFSSYGTLAGKTSFFPNIQHPGPKNLTSIQIRFIHRDLNAFEEALYSDYFADPRIGYAKYIDVDSFVDYYLLNEFSTIKDAFQLSTFAYKDIGGKLTMTVWDFNNGFDNYPWFESPADRGFVCANKNWADRLLNDRAFTDKVVARYAELRSSLWKTSRIMALLDEDIEYLGDAIDRNFSVWGYTFSDNLLGGGDRDPKSYEDAVSKLKANIETRLDYMDRNIESLYDLCIN